MIGIAQNSSTQVSKNIFFYYLKKSKAIIKLIKKLFKKSSTIMWIIR